MQPFRLRPNDNRVYCKRRSWYCLPRLQEQQFRLQIYNNGGTQLFHIRPNGNRIYRKWFSCHRHTRQNYNDIQSQSNRQSTYMNDDNTVEVDNQTEILCTQVTLLLKFPASNKSWNATQKLFQDFLVKIQQRVMHFVFLLWPSSNNNSSAIPIKHPNDVSKGFQLFQTYSPWLNRK